MVILKFVIGIVVWSLIIRLYQYLKEPIQKKVKLYYRKIKFFFRRIYRLITIGKIENQVWEDLFKYHDKAKWSFGKYEKEKRIECNFKINDSDNVDFEYSVGNRQLTFKSTLLYQFDEEITDEIFILASHFNSLLHFGVVKVSVKYNYVSYEFSRDLLVYSLYSGEISGDTDSHFNIAKDCYWAFKKLLETGEPPVFIISELLERNGGDSSQGENISN